MQLELKLGYAPRPKTGPGSPFPSRNALVEKHRSESAGSMIYETKYALAELFGKYSGQLEKILDHLAASYGSEAARQAKEALFACTSGHPAEADALRKFAELLVREAERGGWAVHGAYSARSFASAVAILADIRDAVEDGRFADAYSLYRQVAYKKEGSRSVAKSALADEPLFWEMHLGWRLNLLSADAKPP